MRNSPPPFFPAIRGKRQMFPVPTAMPDWTRLAASGLGEVARHHIALAAPQRVLLFGRAQLELFGIARERARGRVLCAKLPLYSHHCLPVRSTNGGCPACQICRKAYTECCDKRLVG